MEEVENHQNEVLHTSRKHLAVLTAAKCLKFKWNPKRESRVDAIRVMYENPSATVLTSEGESELTPTLAYYKEVLFILVLHYVLRMAVPEQEGLMLSMRTSRKHHAQQLPD